MRALLVLVFIVFSMAAGAQADSYVCIADAATGFSFNESTKTWGPTNFNVNSQKYILARSKEEGAAWTVTMVGTKYPISLCTDDIGGKDDYLTCSGLAMDFYFSLKTLRFMAVFPIGYVRGSWGTSMPEGANEPALVIGKCSPL